MKAAASHGSQRHMLRSQSKRARRAHARASIVQKADKRRVRVAHHIRDGRQTLPQLLELALTRVRCETQECSGEWIGNRKERETQGQARHAEDASQRKPNPLGLKAHRGIGRRRWAVQKPADGVEESAEKRVGTRSVQKADSLQDTHKVLVLDLDVG